MLQVIEYKQENSIISAAFKKYNFIVYAQMGVIEGFTKEQYLQRLYEQCKSSIDYETERYNQGLPNSIISDKEGVEFIPETPQVKSIRLIVNDHHIQFEEVQESVLVELVTNLKDQYGYNIESEISINATYGTITENTLTIQKVDEYTEVLVTAKVNDITDTATIHVYPYEELKPSMEQVRIQELEQQLLEVQDYIVNKQYEELLSEGGL